MERRNFLRVSALMGAAFSVPTLVLKANSNEKIAIGDDYSPDIQKIRALADTIVGDLPLSLNVIKVADTKRPANLVLYGENPDRMINLVRTAYQLSYPTGTIMIDSGMDSETHKHFGKNNDPFYPENFEIVNKASLQANMILITHYHADHVAGVVRSKRFEDIAHKVWVSKDTAELMINKPHKPTVQITKEKVEKFIIADFNKYYPVAPGVVAIKSPGHSPDSKMFYIRLQNGKEFIHSVDTGWTLENIITGKMKNAPWIKEDKIQLQKEFKWLNHIMKNEKNVTVLATHDTPQFDDLTKSGILKIMKI